MLVQSSPPLAGHIAAIAADLRAAAEATTAQAGLVAALHALILAALVRLISRLEDLVALWQAGQLPPQAPARRTRRIPPSTPETAPRSPSRTPARYAPRANASASPDAAPPRAVTPESAHPSANAPAHPAGQGALASRSRHPAPRRQKNASPAPPLGAP